MHPNEFSQIRCAIETLAPARCLEWGSGGSTKWFLRNCPFITSYLSIEHHRGWYEKVNGLINDPRLKLVHVAPNQDLPPGKVSKKVDYAWREKAEQDPSMFQDYVDFPKTEEPFDWVFVDGRARRFCIKQGFELLRPGGLLVLHDAQRKEYHDVLHELGKPVFLGQWKNGQVCLLRKNG